MSLWNELQRRRIFRVAPDYAVTARLREVVLLQNLEWPAGAEDAR